MYLGSNRILPEIEGVFPLLGGEDDRWGYTTLQNIKKIDTEYILFIQEDFLLEEMVSTEVIDMVLTALVECGGHCVRLNDSFMKKHSRNPWRLIENPPGESFRVSLQSSIWKKDTLLSLILENETPWQFEIQGTKRAERLVHGFYMTNGRSLSYYFGGAVNHGELMLNFYAWMKKMKIYNDPKHLMTQRRFLDLFFWYAVYDKIPFQTILPKDRIRQLEALSANKFERVKNFLAGILASHFLQ